MRALARSLHRWVGLVAAVVLATSGMTGALLVVAHPLDERINAHLHRSSIAHGKQWSAAAIDRAQHQLSSEFARATLTFRLPRSADQSLKVYVRGGGWDGEVFFDHSGRELGRRAEAEGFFGWLFELHSNLLAEDAGKLVLFTAAVAYLLLLVAGLVAWWPKRWQGALRIELRRGWRRWTFDAHRVGGAVLGALVLVSVASGAYMAYRPISIWVNVLAATPSMAPPVPQPVDSAQHSGVTGSAAARQPVSALMAAADRALPQGRLSMVVWPADADKAVRMRKQLPDEVHPNGLSSVWLHPISGEPLRVVPWRSGDAGLIGFEYLYPLHTGELGGSAHQVLNALVGMALLFFAVTGPLLWLARRRAARATRTATIARARLSRRT